MRCDQCKFWKEDEEVGWEAAAAGFRLCTAIRERWVIADEASEGVKWDSDEDGAYMKSRREALRKSRAYVQDGSEYRAEFATGPDFFCALFEQA